MAARRIVANTEEGGSPFRPFRPSTGDSSDGGVKLRGGGGGARLRLWGRRWDRLRSWCSLNEQDINYVCFSIRVRIRPFSYLICLFSIWPFSFVIKFRLPIVIGQ